MAGREYEQLIGYDPLDCFHEECGAAEVHMRIASLPDTHPCFYGVDTPSQDQLIAARMTVDEIAAEIGVNSLAFITVDGM